MQQKPQQQQQQQQQPSKQQRQKATALCRNRFCYNFYQQRRRVYNSSNNSIMTATACFFVFFLFFFDTVTLSTCSTDVTESGITEPINSIETAIINGIKQLPGEGGEEEENNEIITSAFDKSLKGEESATIVDLIKPPVVLDDANREIEHEIEKQEAQDRLLKEEELTNVSDILSSSEAVTPSTSFVTLKSNVLDSVKNDIDTEQQLSETTELKNSEALSEAASEEQSKEEESLNENGVKETIKEDESQEAPTEENPTVLETSEKQEPAEKSGSDSPSVLEKAQGEIIAEATLNKSTETTIKPVVQSNDDVPQSKIENQELTKISLPEVIKEEKPSLEAETDISTTDEGKSATSKQEKAEDSTSLNAHKEANDVVQPFATEATPDEVVDSTTIRTPDEVVAPSDEKPSIEINDTLSVVFKESLNSTDPEPPILINEDNFEQIDEPQEDLEATTLVPEESTHNVIKKQGVELVEVPETDDKKIEVKENELNEKIELPINLQNMNFDDVVPSNTTEQESQEDVNSEDTIEATTVANNDVGDAVTPSPTGTIELSITLPGKGDESTGSIKGSRSINALHSEERPTKERMSSHDFEESEEDLSRSVSEHVGSALPTTRNLQKSSVMIISFCGCVVLLFLIFSVSMCLVSFRKQRGVLDIEMQEQRCGKDNLDDDGNNEGGKPDSTLKLLEIELPPTTINIATNDVDAETEPCL